MDMPTTQAELLSFLGVRDLAGVSAPRRFAYEYVIPFATTVSAGGSSTQQVQIDTDGFFVVLAKSLNVYNPSTALSAIARTPPALEASPTAASNTWPTLGAFDVQLQTQAQVWSNQRVNALAIFGTGPSPAWEIMPRVIPPGQLVQATLYNNSPIDVQGGITLYGYRLLKN